MNEVERPIRQPPDCLSPAGQMGLGATPQNKQSTRRVANPEPEEKVVTRIKTTQKKRSALFRRGFHGSYVPDEPFII
jgi:hypothetical protein